MNEYNQKSDQIHNCFKWDESEGFRLNQKTDYWELKIPPKYLQRVTPEALKCLKYYGVKSSILRRKPFMDNVLIQKFKDIINKKKS